MARLRQYEVPGTPVRPPRRMLVTELQHVVLIRNGSIDRALPPGRHWLSRGRDRVVTLSALPAAAVLASQEILTADGVTVRATVALQYVIKEPITTLKAGDWYQRLYMGVQVALRSAVTQVELEDLVANRGSLDEPLLAEARAIAAEIGLEVEQLGIRDLVVPGEQRRLLAQIVEARLAGQAALERARGETATMRNLANAAGMIRDNPDLYKVRLLQEIANSTGNTFHIGTDST